VAHPELARPEPVRAEPPRLEAARPEPARPQLVRPEPVEPVRILQGAATPGPVLDSGRRKELESILTDLQAALKLLRSD
jgi:hypothetical protein